jgi:Ca2+-binding RTX toxin-like protein
MTSKFESVEQRIMFAATSLENGILQVTGNETGDAITVNTNATGEIVVDINGEATNFNPNDVNQINVDALGGNDRVVINVNKPSRVDLGAGRDTALGGDGIDTFFGGAGDDSVDGNKGNDVANLGDGNDTFTWDPGDGSDVVEGDAGRDVLQFNGSNGDEIFDVSANGARVKFFRNLGNINMDLDNVERVNVEALGGEDQITVNDMTGTDMKEVVAFLEGVPGGGEADTRQDLILVNGTEQADKIKVERKLGFNVVSGLATNVLIAHADPTLDELTVAGLGGDDQIDASKLKANTIGLSLQGGDGADTFTGSQGDDFVLGGKGADVAFMGNGDDTFQWDPGDGSDKVEGQQGLDILLFNGSGGDEIFDASANGNRLRFFRNLGTIVMDCDDVETVELNALGGADQITVNDLSKTDVQKVNVHLGPTADSGTGDGAVDNIVINGSSKNDKIAVSSDAENRIDVTGLSAAVQLVLEEPTDTLRVNAGGGKDLIDASELAANLIDLTLDGGKHNDRILGSIGVEDLLGGDGADTLDGNQGNDNASGGGGDDLFIWDPGDGSDVLEGQAGFNTMLFNGSGGDEIMELSANGTRAKFTRNLGNIVMDLNDVQRVEVKALGGADRITSLDLAGTDVTQVEFDGGDGADTLVGGPGAQTLLGGNGDDDITSDAADTVDFGADN